MTGWVSGSFDMAEEIIDKTLSALYDQITTEHLKDCRHKYPTYIQEGSSGEMERHCAYCHATIPLERKEDEGR